MNRKMITDQRLIIEELKNVYISYDLYVPDNTLFIFEGVVSEDSITPELIKLINLEEVDQVIFDMSGNPSYSEKRNLTIPREKINKPCYVWSSNVTHYNKPLASGLLFFPCFELGAHHGGSTAILNDKRQHTFGCLNGTAWSHRKLTYLALSKKSYFKEMIFSWGHSAFGLDYLDEDHINDIVLTDTEKDELDTLPKKIEAIESDRNINNDHTIVHPAYSECYVNIITETCSRKSTPALTEKTLKPILAEQFFLLIGSPYCIDYLRQTRFDVFDDIIDHSYDNEPDDRKRIAMVIDQVDALNNQNLEKLFLETKERRQANKNWLLSDEYKNQFLPLTYD